MIIRRIIASWLAWRSRRAMERVVPGLRELNMQQLKCRKGHKKGSASIDKQKKQAVCMVLAGTRLHVGGR